MAKVKLKTSAVVDRQVPEFVRDDHQKFIKFLEAYYEWLEQNYKTRELENLADIDSTLDEYVEYFADQFITSLPRSMIVDRRLIVKHAKEIYLAKGTPKSYDLLFRLMFNEEPQEIYYPKRDMLRVSDGKWSQKYILRGIDLVGDSFELIGETIVQDPISVFDEPASARVEAVVKYNIDQQLITEITLNANSIIGVFEPNQPIKGVSNRIGTDIRVNLISYINDVSIFSEGKYNITGDSITIAEGDGTDARVEINTVKTGGIDKVIVVDGGENHYVGQPVLFDNTDAGFASTNRVEGAVAKISEVYLGSFLLESAERFRPNYSYNAGERIIYKQHEYEVTVSGTTSNVAPTHVFGSAVNGGTTLKHVGRAGGKLLDENSDEISLERTRYYKIDAYGNYDSSISTPVLNDGFGPVKAVRILSPGSSYNKLPKVGISTDLISEIKTTANSNVITVKTSLIHELIVGQQVTISGSFNREVDGTWTVNTIPDSFTFTFRANQIYQATASIADKVLVQVMYADRSANPNSIRTYSNAKLLPVSNQVGAISGLVLPNFGYNYNTARLTAPAYLQVDKRNGSFITNEEIELLPQSICLEKGENEFLLESGDKFLVESQQNPKGFVVSFDSNNSLLKLDPASNRTGFLLEDGLSSLFTENSTIFVHENSALFTTRGLIRGKTSGTVARILDVAVAGVKANLGAIGLTTGEFTNSDGKISDGAKRIQDSFYYQDYSYVVRIGQSVNKYRDAVKKLLHPVGLALFGEVNLINLISATLRVMRNASILTAKLELDLLRVKILAAGNWQQETSRILVDNSGRYPTLGLEGGFRDTFITENGFPLVFENGNTIISERTAPDGDSILLETGVKILSEEYESTFFPEHLLQEYDQFFRLETDNTHTKSRNPDVRKEMWTLFYEDFVPSYSDFDTLKLEIARIDGDGVVEDEGNDLLLEDGGRILKQIQLSKPAPSMRILQSEMLPPVIIEQTPLNVVHLLEMSPQVLKELLFGIKTKISVNLITGFFSLENGDIMLMEDGSKLATTSKYPVIPGNQSENNLYVECVPPNTELDNMLLEDGYFMLTEDPFPPATTFVATINAAAQGSLIITGNAPKISLNNEPITGMKVFEGFALPFTIRANFGEGTIEEVDYRQDIVPFTIRLTQPLQQDITQNTPLVSLVFKIQSNKFKKDDNEQYIYRANFNVVDVPYRNISSLGKSTIQSRASFRQVGSAISFLEQRKFNFPPYTYGSKGSLQVVPGDIYVGVAWQATTAVLTKQVVNVGGRAYEVTSAGTTSSSAPTHTSGTEFNGSALLYYIGPTKPDRTYLPATADGGLTGGWYQNYPNPNRDYWNSEYVEMEDGDRLLQESGDEYILEALQNTGDTQIKDFAKVTVYDLINRKHKRSNFAVGAYVEIYKTA